MPPKIRELISDLERSGFIDRGGKGSHQELRAPESHETNHNIGCLRR